MCMPDRGRDGAQWRCARFADRATEVAGSGRKEATMKDESEKAPARGSETVDALSLPLIVDRGAFEAELGDLRAREKAHTREGDAIAAARRRLPMVEIDPTILLVGRRGPLTLLDAFEG